LLRRGGLGPRKHGHGQQDRTNCSAAMASAWGEVRCFHQPLAVDVALLAMP